MTSPQKIQRLTLASPAIDPSKELNQPLRELRQHFAAPEYAITRDERGLFTIVGSQLTTYSDGSNSWVVQAEAQIESVPAPACALDEGRLQTPPRADEETVRSWIEEGWCSPEVGEQFMSQLPDAPKGSPEPAPEPSAPAVNAPAEGEGLGSATNALANAQQGNASLPTSDDRLGGVTGTHPHRKHKGKRS